MAEHREVEKRLAAAKSLDFVEDGMSLGLGSGSTAVYMVVLLGRRVAEGLRVRGVPTSDATHRLAQQVGIPLVTLEEVPRLDLTIDGADEVDSALNLIKGGGGALLREKVVASASDRVVIIVDSTKRVDTLGAFPLPVEVVPFAWRPVSQKLQELGGKPTLRLHPKGDRYVTDEGNYILDCAFREISDAANFAQALDAIPGIVEHGLFIDLADIVIVGRGDTVEIMDRN